MPGFLSVRAYDFVTPGEPAAPGENIIRTIQYAWTPGVGDPPTGMTYLGLEDELPDPYGYGTWQYGPSVYGPLSHPTELAEPANIAVWNDGFWFDVGGVPPSTPPPLAFARTND